MATQEHSTYIPNEATVKPDLDHPEITLINDNPILLDIVRTLPFQWPDWENIVHEIDENSGMQERRHLTSAPSWLKGRMAETWLEQALRTIRNNADWKEEVNLTPLTKQTESQHYRLEATPRTMGHARVIRKVEDPKQSRVNASITDYDRVITIQASPVLPVVFEVKMDTVKRSRNKKRKGRVHALDMRNIRKKLTPLQEILQTDKFGYVVIFPENNVRLQYSSAQREFVKKGGILLPFPIGNARFSKQSQRAQNYFGRKG